MSVSQKLRPRQSLEVLVRLLETEARSRCPIDKSKMVDKRSIQLPRPCNNCVANAGISMRAASLRMQGSFSGLGGCRKEGGGEGSKVFATWGPVISTGHKWPSHLFLPPFPSVTSASSKENISVLIFFKILFSNDRTKIENSRNFLKNNTKDRSQNSVFKKSCSRSLNK